MVRNTKPASGLLSLVACILLLYFGAYMLRPKSSFHEMNRRVGSILKFAVPLQHLDDIGHEDRFAIVRPASPHDVFKLLKSFDLWDDDKYAPCEVLAEGYNYKVDLIISFSRRTSETDEMGEALKKLFKAKRGWGGCFNSIELFDSGLSEEEDIYRESIQNFDPNWVNGPNAQFRATYKHIKEEGYHAMYLMEADSYPMVEGWLNMLLDEVREVQPFGILGSKYKGHVWDRFKLRMPPALLNHLNGNSVYNLSSPLLNIVIDELESEKESLYRAVSYDYRISQILTEASSGIPSKFPFPSLLEGIEETVALPSKMSKYQDIWYDLGYEGFLADSKVLGNYGAVKDVIEDTGGTPIVHGGQYNPLNWFEEDQAQDSQNEEYSPLNWFEDEDQVQDAQDVEYVDSRKKRGRVLRGKTAKALKKAKGTKSDPGPYANAASFNSNSRLLKAYDSLSNFKHVNDHSDGHGTPMLWLVPETDGVIIRQLFSTCWQLNTACEGIPGKPNTGELLVEKSLGGTINVDVTTPVGIENAKQRGLSNSSLVKALASPYLYESNGLFSASDQGQLFALFRHPVERALSLFHHLQYAEWEPTYRPEFKTWTELDFAYSELVEDNWMTRFLSNKQTGDINEDHVKIALDVLRQKFLVGLSTNIDESIARLEAYFQMEHNKDCIAGEIFKARGYSNTVHTDPPKPGDLVWDILEEANAFDMAIYREAEKLFAQQALWFEASA